MNTAAQTIDNLFEQLGTDPQVRLTDVAHSKQQTGLDLEHRFTRARGRLLAAGIEPQQTVLFAIRPSTTALVYLAALLSVGVRVVLTDLLLPQRLLATQMERVSPSAVITEPMIAVASRWPFRFIAETFGKKIPPIHTLAPRVMTTRRGRSIQPDVKAPAPADSALVVFTSGTTGIPKAVVHTQASLAFMVTALSELMGEAQDKVVYSDQFHSILPALAAGAHCVIGPTDLSDEKVAEALQRYDVDVWFTTPSRARSVTSILRDHTPGHLVLGSSPVTSALVAEVIAHRPGVILTGVYAMTEAVPVAVADGADITSHNVPGDLVGNIVAGIDVRIDADGEIWLRGPRVGFHLGDEEAEWVATGDLGHTDSDGRLVLDGRSKDMILSKGRNIYPQHFEPEFNSLSGVVASALVGLRDPYGDESVWLIIESDLSQDTIKKELEALPAVRSLGIEGAVFAAMPRGRQGKLDRKACRELAASAATNGTAIELTHN